MLENSCNLKLTIKIIASYKKKTFNIDSLYKPIRIEDIISPLNFTFLSNAPGFWKADQHEK